MVLILEAQYWTLMFMLLLLATYCKESCFFHDQGNANSVQLENINSLWDLTLSSIISNQIVSVPLFTMYKNKIAMLFL